MRRIKERHSKTIAMNLIRSFESDELEDVQYVAEDIAKGILIGLQRMYQGDRPKLLYVLHEVSDILEDY